MPETLDEFKNSFAYGSRSDLMFKFLRSFSADEAGQFFQSLLRKIGESIDDGDFDRVVQHVYESQVRGYQPKPGADVRWKYADGPFTPLKKPLSESRVALLSSGGHFVDGHDPEPLDARNMAQEEAERRIGEFLRSEPVLTEIPVDTPPEMLRVRHGGYDVRGALADHNVVLPLDAMKEAEVAGAIGIFHPIAYTFVGAAAQLPLLKKVAPGWAEKLHDEHIDTLVMVPV